MQLLTVALLQSITTTTYFNLKWTFPISTPVAFMLFFVVVFLDYMFLIKTYLYRMGLQGLMTHPPVTSCCQAIAPHWKKPDEINAGCWLLQFHGTPHCHPECLSPDWDICKLSSPINSCLVWCCLCPSNSDSELLWCNISSFSSVCQLEVRIVAKEEKKKGRVTVADEWWSKNPFKQHTGTRIAMLKPFLTSYPALSLTSHDSLSDMLQSLNSISGSKSLSLS